ncbi:MAG: FtsX-like permease family protein [Aeromicrobium sp.]|uniref:ABC transporter permease n=1 Tax=Aeromicrobium sp. TaxID=1871063 RepID=UPI0039E726EF
MIGLTWRTLLTGGARSVVTMLVLAIGAFLLSFALIASATTTRALADGVETPYRHTDVVVATSSEDASAADTPVAREITADDAEAVGGIDGVEAASGFVGTTAIVRAGDRVRGLTVESLPTDGAFVWQRLDDGVWPTTTSEIALSAQTLDDLGLTVGDRVVFGKKDIGPGTFTIVGSVDTRGALDYQNGSYGVVAPEIAQALAGVTGFTELRLRLAPGADAAEVVAEINTLVPEVWPIATSEITGGADSVFGTAVGLLRDVVIGLISVALAVAVIVLATVYGASLTARSRLLALQRCVGATRGQVMASVVAEAALLALLGGVIGVGLAVLAAWALLPVFERTVSTAAAEAFHVPWSSLVAPILVVVALGAVASLLPAWRASRVPPSRALAAATELPPEPGASRLRLLAGLALLVTGAVALSLGSARTAPALVAAGVAATGAGLFALSLPAYSGVATAVGVAARRFRSVSGELLGANIRRNPRRSASLGVSVTLAAVVTMTAWTALDSARSTLLERISASPSVDLTVGDASSSETPVDTESLQAIARLDGVEHVLGVVAADDVTMTGTAAPSVGDNGEVVADQTLGDEQSAEATWDVAVAQLDLDDLDVMRVPYDLDEVDDTTVYLPSSRYAPFDDDQPVTLAGPLGEATVDVEYVDGLDLPAFVSPALYERLTDTGAVRTAWIAIDRSTDQSLLMDRVRAEAVLAGDQAVGGALPSTLRLDAALSIVRTAAIALLSAAMLVALIGLAATTALTVAERRHENAVLRALGLERDQLRRTLVGEAITLGLTGTVLGALLGAAYGLVAAVGVAEALDLRAVASIPALALLLVIAVPAVVVWLTTSSAVERASHVPPAHALIPR